MQMNILAGLENLSIYDDLILCRLLYTIKHNRTGSYFRKSDDVMVNLQIISGGLYGYICNIHFIVVIFPSVAGDIKVYKHQRFRNYGTDINIKNYCYENLDLFIGELTVGQLLYPGPVTLFDLLLENRDLDVCCLDFANIVMHFMLFYNKNIYTFAGSADIDFICHYGYDGFISNGRYIIIMNCGLTYYNSKTYVQIYDKQTHRDLNNYLDNYDYNAKSCITNLRAKTVISDMNFCQFMGSKVKSARNF